MVHSILTKSGGALALDSVKGKGTTVELWFPVEQREGMAASVPGSFRSLEGRTGPLTVLAVDDDALVLTNLVMMLENLGHKVRRAGSGRQALEILAREASVDLLVADQVMPGMTGWTLIETVRDMRPNLRAVLACGRSERPPVVGELITLAKPFRQEDLLRAIAEVFAKDVPNQNVLTFQGKTRHSEAPAALASFFDLNEGASPSGAPVGVRQGAEDRCFPKIDGSDPLGENRVRGASAEGPIVAQPSPLSRR
jgi:CheY-like chemotaxis protein